MMMMMMMNRALITVTVFFVSSTSTVTESPVKLVPQSANKEVELEIMSAPDMLTPVSIFLKCTDCCRPNHQEFASKQCSSIVLFAH